MICLHCREQVTLNPLWNMWDHKNRFHTGTAQLCEPEKGFDKSTFATPTFGE